MHYRLSLIRKALRLSGYKTKLSGGKILLYHNFSIAYIESESRIRIVYPSPIVSVSFDWFDLPNALDKTFDYIDRMTQYIELKTSKSNQLHPIMKTDF